MRRLKGLVCALVLVFSPIPALAGTIDIGGFCDSAACTQQFAPMDGGFWMYIGSGLWQVMPIIY
jgi:hypothetical protein